MTRTRYSFERFGGVYLIFDAILGHSRACAIAEIREADTAQRIVDALNALDARPVA